MNIELKPTTDDHNLVETAVKIFKENDCCDRQKSIF